MAYRCLINAVLILFLYSFTTIVVASAEKKANTHDNANKFVNDGFPIGIWKSTKGELLEDLDLTSLSIYSYKSGLVLMEQHELDGKHELYSVKESDRHATPHLNDYYLDNKELSFQIKSDNKILLYENDSVTVLRRTRTPKPNIENFVGIWESEYEGEIYTLSIDESFNVVCKDEDTIICNAKIIYDPGAGFLLKDTLYSRHYVNPIKLINKKQLALFAQSDEFTTFTQVNNQPQTTVLIDENGNPVTIDKLTINTHYSELMVETTLDIIFTNPNKSSNEVAFKLPLPSEAIVIGYSLDINGVMIPSSAIEKEQARRAFEQIQARGVDPAIADISTNNQFSTEIFPVDYQQQRRISITYIEPIKYDKKKRALYSFPLHKIGLANKVKLEVSGEKKNANVKGLKGLWSKDSKEHLWTYQAEAHNYLAKKAITIKLSQNSKPDQAIKTDISQAQDGDYYLTATGKLPKPPSDKPVKKVVIAWDNSLSMRPYHQHYLSLMKEYFKRLNGVDLNVFTFAESINKINVENNNRKQIIQQISSIEYDSASNFENLNAILKHEADYFVLFSDGIATINTGSTEKNEQTIFSIAPPDADINIPLLKFISTNGNYFQLTKKNKARVAKAIGKSITKINVNAVSDNIDEIAISRPYGFNSNFIISAKLKNTESGSIKLQFSNGETQTINIDPSIIRKNEEGKYLWTQSTLQPLLAQPKKNRTVITELGKKYKIATPFTSLIVLEEFSDYVEYGIRPPSEIEGHEDYDADRAYVLEEQKLDQETANDNLLEAWQDRLTWWQDPIAAFKLREELRRQEEERIRQYRERLLKQRQARLNQQAGSNAQAPSYSDEGEAGLEEAIVVTGIRSSIPPDQSISIEPWSPDTPYMKVILKASQDKQYETYLDQRETYQTQVSFYMDVAKHFFEQGRNKLGAKIVLNILELMPNSVTMQRTVAYVLLQYQQYQLAISVLEKVDQTYSFQAASKRDLARAWEGLARKTGLTEDYANAIRYYFEAATKVDDDPEGLPVIALTEMNHLLSDAKTAGVNANWIPETFLGNQSYDVRALLSWSNNQTDVDLHVLDPNGDNIYYSNPFSKIGGFLPYDNTSGFGPEVFLLKDGTPGSFKISAKYYSDNSAEAFGPVTLILDLYLNYGKENQQHKTTSIQINKEKQEIDVGEINF